MALPVLMPRQGQSVESCLVNEWLVKPGDAVREGQPLASIETDKATFEVEAPGSGTVLALLAEEGDDVPVLTPIAVLGEPGEAVPDFDSGNAAAVSSADAPPSSHETAAAPAADGAEVSGPEKLREGEKKHGISPRARRAALDAGLAPETLTGTGPGGRVIARDVAGAAAGLPGRSAAVKDAVRAGAALPAAGSGPGGRILLSDLRNEGGGTFRSSETAEEVPVRGIRKLVAQRMKASLDETAQLTMTRGVDASAILALRARVKSLGASRDLPNITLNDMIAFAAARTLAAHPELNAHFLGDRIRRFPQVNLGVAVDTPKGLLVPVIRGADTLSLRELSVSIRTLAEACQQGRVNPDDLQGGSFTLTNLGGFGVETFTPVLNAPEVAILGVGAPVLRPVRSKEGGVAYAEVISLSLTVDHQAVDGAPAARFLAELALSIESFETLFI